jgi:hypothetical protein
VDWSFTQTLAPLLLGSTGEAVGGRGMPPGSHAQPAANTKTQQKDSLAGDSI